MIIDSIFKYTFITVVAAATIYGLSTYYESAVNFQKFQRNCETRCAPRRVATPIVGGEAICICDEGYGLWRMVRFDR